MKKTVKFESRPLITDSGFSLVELTIVSVLVAIVSLISLPTFYNIVQKQRLKKSSLIVADYLEKARKQAIQYDYPCRVNIDNSALEISNSNIDGTNNPDPKPNQCFNDNSLTVDLNSSSNTPPDGLKLCSISLGSDRDITQSAVIGGLTFTDSQCDYSDPQANPPDDDYSESSIANSTITYTPAGLTTGSILVKLKYENSSVSRCILVVAPTAVIRKGIDAGGSGCDFTNFN